MQRQSHQNADVVDGWRCLPPVVTKMSACSMTTLRHGEFEPPFKSSMPTHQAMGSSTGMPVSAEEIYISTQW